MRKPLVSLVLIVMAVLSVGRTVLSAEEEPVQARMVTVSRGDVHQVVAISGRLMYADEAYVLAETSGQVERICVEPGQRIAAGEILLHMDGARQESAVSAWLENGADVADLMLSAAIDAISMEHTIIRSDKDCTVRQVLIEEDATVMAGTPLMRITSNDQRIHCHVAAKDASEIREGMWAWISAQGDAMGMAAVYSISKAKADEATGMQMVEVALQPEMHLDLPEGAVIDAEIFLAGADDVLSVPVEAITPKETVWWVCDGRCTEIPAQIVLCDEMRAWVELPEGIQLAVGEFQEGQRLREADE